MPIVAITGVAGYLGRIALAAAESLPDVRRVVGVDVAPAPQASRLEHYQMDVRDPALARVLADVDVIVHLAHAHDGHDRREVNVGGLLDVIAAAPRARIVYVSSVVVYGAHPDNDVPLREDAPVRPVLEYPASADHAEAERLLRPSDVILRTCVVAGPNVAGRTARLLASPLLHTVEGYNPSIQFVHEDDFEWAVAAAIDGRLTGIVNVAPDDWIPLEEAATLLGRHRLASSYETARRRSQRLWRAGLTEVSPSFLPYLMHPWVVSNGRLHAAGVTPRHSTAEALAEAARSDAVRGWVSMGRLRFHPRRTVSVLVTCAALLAAAAGRRARQRDRSGTA